MNVLYIYNLNYTHTHFNCIVNFSHINKKQSGESICCYSHYFVKIIRGFKLLISSLKSHAAKTIIVAINLNGDTFNFTNYNDNKNKFSTEKIQIQIF